MLQNKVCLVAQGVTIDNQTNAVSIFSMVEGVAASGFPVFMQNINFFTLLTRDAADPHEYDGLFTISMGEEELIRQLVHLVFGDKLRNRLVIRIPGVVVTRPGQLAFRLTVNDSLVADYVTEVTL